MANLPLNPALTPGDGDPAPDTTPAPPVSLPDDMQGWLTTEQAGERLKLSPKKMREYASVHALPKQKVGIRVYYAMETVEAAVRERAALRKAQAAQKRAAQKPPAPEAPASRAQAQSARPMTPLEKAELLRQAMNVMGQIVHQIGRVG